MRTDDADPTGLAGGWATGISGSICNNFNLTIGNTSYSGIKIATPFGIINPCDPVLSAGMIGLKYSIEGVASLLGSSPNVAAIAAKLNKIAPYISAALTITCSIDNFNNDACGDISGWTSDAFTGKNKWVGTGISDLSALIGAYLCSAGGPTSPGCIGYAIYSIANYLFSYFWDLFGPAKFTGSLLPRPTDLGGLGTTTIGIPNQNLSTNDLLGHSSHKAVPTPGAFKQ